MKLKKANAVLGILAIFILLTHAGYQVVAYILFIYNPLVTKLLGWAAAAVVSLHAILGMSMLMLVHDGGKIYKKTMTDTLRQGAQNPWRVWRCAR